MAVYKEDDTMDQEKFEAALRVFVEGCQNIHTSYMARTYGSVMPDEISSNICKRYATIIRWRADTSG